MLQATWAQAAFPGRQVISLSGDGGFTMMMGDFVTLIRPSVLLAVLDPISPQTSVQLRP
jgi:pyruvate dehydrogenase (quinone)